MIATKIAQSSSQPRQLRDLVTGKPLPSLEMTEEQFVEWATEKVRAEWVDGRVILMSPVTVEHDDLMSYFSAVLRTMVEVEDWGTVHASEILVRLASQRAQRLPDLKLVSKARQGIIQRAVIDGPPDVIFEIVSKDSVSRDYRDKYNQYEAAGVREYWIVDPLQKTVEVHTLHGKKYKATAEIDGWLRSTVLPKFAVQPNRLFKRPLPPVIKTLKELGIKLT
jgi:Uma2 family endonuclease